MAIRAEVRPQRKAHSVDREEVRGRPVRHLHGRAALLGGTQDRHGASVVRPYCRRRPQYR
jgi:hypothetical protein